LGEVSTDVAGFGVGSTVGSAIREDGGTRDQDEAEALLADIDVDSESDALLEDERQRTI
jgi:hypothetical protein